MGSGGSAVCIYGKGVIRGKGREGSLLEFWEVSIVEKFFCGVGFREGVRRGVGFRRSGISGEIKSCLGFFLWILRLCFVSFLILNLGRLY